MKSTTFAKFVRALERNGWVRVRKKGKHRKYRKGDRTLTVPFHPGDIGTGLLAELLKQSGLTETDF